MKVPARTDPHAHYLRRRPDEFPSDDDAPEHLAGGRRRQHMDPGALAYLVNTLGIESMLDVGCGLGGMVEFALEQGLRARGIDGDPHGEPDVLWDFQDGPYTGVPPVDLVWSVEFVEHVDEAYLDNFCETFRLGRWLAITFAPPGKEGRHHVNLREEPYWIETMEGQGFRHEPELTAGFRAASDMRSVEWDGSVRPNKRKRFITDYGLVFSRDGATAT